MVEFATISSTLSGIIVFSLFVGNNEPGAVFCVQNYDKNSGSQYV
jgi:hypothetical protein